jgi:hypothetical protein
MQISDRDKLIGVTSRAGRELLHNFAGLKHRKMNVGVRARRKQQVRAIHHKRMQVYKLGMAADAGGARIISQFYLFSMTPPHARCSLTSKKKHFEFVH